MVGQFADVANGALGRSSGPCRSQHATDAHDLARCSAVRQASAMMVSTGWRRRSSRARCRPRPRPDRDTHTCRTGRWRRGRASRTSARCRPGVVRRTDSWSGLCPPRGLRRRLPGAALRLIGRGTRRAEVLGMLGPLETGDGTCEATRGVVPASRVPRGSGLVERTPSPGSCGGSLGDGSARGRTLAGRRGAGPR